MCHIAESDNYLYNHDRWQDYPTVAQISRKIAENSVNVIFAVPSLMIPTYKALQERVQGSYVGELSEDSSNIVELVKTNARVIQLNCDQVLVCRVIIVLIHAGNQFYSGTAPPSF